MAGVVVWLQGDVGTSAVNASASVPMVTCYYGLAATSQQQQVFLLRVNVLVMFLSCLHSSCMVRWCYLGWHCGSGLVCVCAV